MTKPTTIPHVRVAGTSLQRGRQYGTQAAGRVHRSVQEYRQVFAHYAGWDWETVRREAARFEAPIADFRPAYLQEMRGIAEGAGLDLADVLAINVRTEVMYAAMARQAPLAARQVPQPPAECSAFAVVPAPSRPGAALVGQNWDWLLHAAHTVVVLEVRQEEGPDFVTVVEAGLLAKTGMNAAGLGLATNALVTDADVGAPGLPYHVLLRAVLDCETVTDAFAVLQAGVRSSSANYLIAHASGSALDIEAAPGDFTRLYPLLPEAGVLLHTNHFLAPQIDPLDLSLWAMPSSAVRLQRLRAALTARDTPPTLDDLRPLLRDHADHPFGICAHPDPRAHRYDQGATIASVVMDLTARHLWYAHGNPCQAPYALFELTPAPKRVPATELALPPGSPSAPPCPGPAPLPRQSTPAPPPAPAAPARRASAAATAARRR
jgi:isopenicillin-N N-acyltransferase-like protein